SHRQRKLLALARARPGWQRHRLLCPNPQNELPRRNAPDHRLLKRTTPMRSCGRKSQKTAPTTRALSTVPKAVETRLYDGSSVSSRFVHQPIAPVRPHSGQSLHVVAAVRSEPAYSVKNYDRSPVNQPKSMRCQLRRKYDQRKIRNISPEERTARCKKYRLLLVHLAGRMSRFQCTLR